MQGSGTPASGVAKSGSVRVLTVTMSDSRNRHTDESGKVLVQLLVGAGLTHVRHVILKEEPRFLQELVRTIGTDNAAEAVVITGGTGIAPRDITVEALDEIFDKRLDGFGEAFRRLSWDVIGPRAVLSRACAGVVHQVMIYALPGSPRSVELGVKELILPTIHHAVELATGRARHHHAPTTGSSST
jgi:molybdenum cofactor biosynthesis protein B